MRPNDTGILEGELSDGVAHGYTQTGLEQWLDSASQQLPVLGVPMLDPEMWPPPHCLTP